MNINIDGNDFEIEIDVDQDIESRELYVEVINVAYSGVDVNEILDPKIYEKICDKAASIVKYGRNDEF